MREGKRKKKISIGKFHTRNCSENDVASVYFEETHMLNSKLYQRLTVVAHVYWLCQRSHELNFVVVFRPFRGHNEKAGCSLGMAYNNLIIQKNSKFI